MICPNCEFEIEDDMEICPYCHVFVEQPGERAEKQGQPAGQTQDVSASPAITSKREFLKSPEMKRSQRYILISLVVTYLSLLSEFFCWRLFPFELEMPIGTPLPLSGWLWQPLSLLWGYTSMKIIYNGILGFSIFAVYLYVICKFGMLLIIQRTYNRVCAMIFLLPQAVWNMWVWFLLLGNNGLFEGIIIGLIEPAAMILLIIILFRVHSAWQRYEKTQTEEKLSWYTVLKGDKI